MKVIGNREGEHRGWPNYLFGGRVRTSTFVLVVAFFATWWVYSTYQPEPAPPVPQTQVVPPGFVPDPDYTWVPRTSVRPRPTETYTRTTTPTTTTTTTTETTSPTDITTTPGSDQPTTPGAPTTVIDPDGPGPLVPTTVVDPDGAGPLPATTVTPSPTVPNRSGIPSTTPTTPAPGPAASPTPTTPAP